MEMKYKIFNNEVFERHKFDQFIITLSHWIDDYDLHAFDGWKETEKSQWICKYVKEIEYHSVKDYASFQTRITVTGFVSPKRWTEFVLKFT